MRAAPVVVMTLIVLSSAMSAAADQIDRFYGYWEPVGERWCNLSRDQWLTEGSQMIVSRNTIFFGNAGGCKEVGLWMDKGRMRVSAACVSEGGPMNILAEFWTDKKGILHGRNGSGDRWPTTYRKCTKAQLDAADAKAKRSNQ